VDVSGPDRADPGGPGAGLAGARLVCGADADALLAQVAEGRGGRPTAHQQDCPHCQAALVEYERAWAPVAWLATEPVHAPDALVEVALQRIRTAAQHPSFGLLPDGGGLTRIAARVVVVTARETAARIPGVRVALGRLTPPGAPGAPRVEAGVAGRSTAIELTLAADYGQDLPALAERIRREVTRAVHQLTGLDPIAVSVLIDDVLT
jgi:uncharacterized alkaline shock family protein YloU